MFLPDETYLINDVPLYLVYNNSLRYGTDPLLDDISLGPSVLVILYYIRHNY
jgi:hypothetical protein